MYNSSHSITSNLFLTVIVGFLGGLIIGYPGWTLSITPDYLGLYQIKQFNRLQHWLMSNDRSDVPESQGYWG